MWLTYQQSVRGAGQSTVVMDPAVEDGRLSRNSLLRVIAYDVPGLHVERSGRQTEGQVTLRSGHRVRRQRCIISSYHLK